MRKWQKVYYHRQMCLKCGIRTMHADGKCVMCDEHGDRLIAHLSEHLQMQHPEVSEYDQEC